jgi:hypothetical protein
MNRKNLTYNLKTGMLAIATLAIVLVSSCGEEDEKTVIELPSLTVIPSTLNLFLGEKGTVGANLAPVTWSSSAATIVSVDASTGEVAALALGTATVTATTSDGKTATGTVVVNPILVTAIMIMPSSTAIGIDSTVQLIATPSPENTTVFEPVWTSSDESVATVTQTGLVTGISRGMVTITATQGSVAKTATVIVGGLIQLSFDSPNSNITLTLNEAGYWDMQATGGDPNCHTAGLTIDVREKKSVSFVFEYQADREITNGQIFYARPNAAGGVSTAEELRFENTGIDPDDESLWREWSFDLTNAIESFSWGAIGHRLRFDFVANVTGARLLVRNPQILYEQ